MQRCIPRVRLGLARAWTAVAGGLLFAVACVGVAAADDATIEPFNGKDLSGWVVEGTKDFKDAGQTRPNWFVKDGAIHCAGKGFGFLRFDKELRDFALSLEYNMQEKCNSGIGIRGVKFTGPAQTRPSFASYEIQILDDAGNQPDSHSSMSLYRYVAAKTNAVKPAGEWNKFEIECRGPKIRITLNGQVVQDVDQSTIAEIKDKPLSGYFSLQCHGHPIQFREIRVKTLK